MAREPPKKTRCVSLNVLQGGFLTFFGDEMPTIKCPDGRTISGSILGQLNFVLKEATNNHKFGIKVRDILSEGYTKQENPYIRSFKTAREYYGIWKNLAVYVKKEFGINRLDEIRPQHIEKFIEDKADLSPKQLKNISAAIGKLETVLKEKFGLSVDYGNKELITGRWLANKLASEMDYRSNRGAYERPHDIIERLSTEAHRLAAELQLKGGFRVHEVNGLKAENLKSGSSVQVRGKGGYVRTVSIPKDLYERVEDYISRHGSLSFAYSSYLNDIREAALWSEQKYQGSHGFRYNYVQNRYEELTNSGYGHHEALKIISEETGHHRLEIVLHYLGRR